MGEEGLRGLQAGNGAGLLPRLTQAMCVIFDNTECAEGCIEAEDFLHNGTNA